MQKEHDGSIQEYKSLLNALEKEQEDQMATLTFSKNNEIGNMFNQSQQLKQDLEFSNDQLQELQDLN